MRSGWLRVLLGAVLLLSFLSHPAAAADSTGRLVANQGFEDGMEGWTTSGAAGAVSVVGAPTHSGKRAAQMADTDDSTGVSLRSAPLATVPGEALTATAWADRTSGAGGWLYLEFWRADGTRAAAFPTALGPAAGWQQLTAEGTAPDDAVTATVLAYSSQSDISTVVWDDAAVTAASPPLRRVPDPGFEEPRNGTAPTEWTVSAPGGTATVATPAHTGLAALRTADTSTANEVSVLSRQVPVEPGEKITASVQAQRVSGASGTLYLEFRDASGTRLGTPPTADVPAGSGWHRVTASGTAPSDAAALTVRLYSSQAATGTTLWDDVALASSADQPYRPALASGATVLFVGDQRVESYTGVSRVVHPGSKQGTDGELFAGSGDWDANPRLSGTVLPDGSGYRMWYTTTQGTGSATSTDGTTWTRGTAPVDPHATGGVVQNPAWTSGSTVPKYFELRPGTTADARGNHYYYPEQSADGTSWQAVPGAQPIPGWDVPNLTYDPASGQFVAMVKEYPVDYPTGSPQTGPRTVWESTSTDFKTWSAPQPAFAADAADNARIPAGTGRHGMVPWSEIYGMPAIRYGDQYLGTPWVFDIAYSPNRTTGDPGPDTGRSHIELAASQDLVNWSRPDRDDIITPGAAGSWDWGFDMTGTTMQNVQVGGEWQTRFYYAAFAGEHSCSDTSTGDCTVPQGHSGIGMVSWPTDRFESFHAGSGGGTVTTRPLTPAGHTLTVNYDPGPSGGALTADVLDAEGDPVDGYTAADSTPVTTDARAPGTAITWTGGSALPAGPLRLRFHLAGGDLYSFTVK